ncbi:hypothetical protein BC829DRAFT_158691 [Chytridium lagenaria]|nr:hypothetical protein BC829DRAFT_158691 [Chytridium lagenaria]
MVKGLDFALLSKMKNELELRMPKRKGKHFKMLYANEFTYSEIDALNYLEGLHGDDDRPKFQSAMAENIFDIVVNRSTHRHPKKNRYLYSWPLCLCF